MGALKCYFCGRFVPYKEYYSWTFYGNTQDLEPPDPNFAHINCFEEKSGENFSNICWEKPNKYGWEH